MKKIYRHYNKIMIINKTKPIIEFIELNIKKYIILQKRQTALIYKCIISLKLIIYIKLLFLYDTL